MKEVLSGALAAVMLFGGLAITQEQAAQPSGVSNSAQNTSGETSPPANSGLRFAPGTVIPVELTKSVDAKKAKTGDGVEAKVTQDLKSGSGQIIVPKDSKVMGHVTEAQPRNKEQKESQVGIIFDRAETKAGTAVTMPMSIQAIIAPNALGGGSSNNAPNSSSQPPDTAAGASMPSSNAGGRTMGSGAGSPSTVSPPPTGGEAPATSETQATPHEQITANTQGVVGISNLKLSPATNRKQGSVVSSEKGNVKLESGTFMLLRVNQ